jgi:predicted HTH transcriptional regulator
LERLAVENLIRRDSGGSWDITNLGAILFAKRLEDFAGLHRKAVRVIAYEGGDRISTLREQVGARGTLPASKD